MLCLFLRFFDLEWSVAERKTEKLRRRFWGLTARSAKALTHGDHRQGRLRCFIIKRKRLCAKMRRIVFFVVVSYHLFISTQICEPVFIEIDHETFGRGSSKKTDLFLGNQIATSTITI